MLIKCPTCNQTCEIDEEPSIGQRLQCPSCGTTFSYAPQKCGELEDDTTEETNDLCESASDKGIAQVSEVKAKENLSKAKSAAMTAKDKIVAWWKNNRGGREVLFSKVKAIVIAIKDKTIFWWKNGKEGRADFFSRVKSVTIMAKDKTIALWNSGRKGKVVICTAPFLVLCLIVCINRDSSAVNQNNANAGGIQHELGDVQDTEKKVGDYRKAAKQDSDATQFSLGVCYVKGDGVPQDYAEAAKWFRLSAEQGNANAQKNLGILYCLGYGVQKDTKEGMRWLKKARDQGNEEARELLMEILK